MIKRTWVVGSLIAATISLSSCASMESWLYGDSDKARSDRQSTSEYASRDDRNARDRDDRMARSDRNA